MSDRTAETGHRTYVVPLRRVTWFDVNIRWMAGYFVLGSAVSMFLAYPEASVGEMLGVGLLGGSCAAVLVGSLTVPIAKWWARRKNDPAALQYAQLNGANIEVFAPWRFVSDLAAEHAVVIGVSGAEASLRWLRAEGDVVLHVDVSPDASFSGAGPAEQRPWGPESGEKWRDKGLRFGDELLAVLHESRSSNRFLSLIGELERAPVRNASAPIVVELDSGPDDATAAPYRQGQPEPGHPGFEAWLEREGRDLGSGLVLGAEHLVTRCADGHRRAFPIGATHARRDGKTLHLAGSEDPQGDECETTVVDPALASAIVIWLHAKRTAH